MTREEAIEYWEGLRKTFSSQLEQEENHFGRMHLQTTIDAIDMAISAIRAKQEKNICGCTKVCKHKCTKRENGYSFCVKCTCGAEFNVDRYYWEYFKKCPNYGAKMDLEG